MEKKIIATTSYNEDEWKESYKEWLEWNNFDPEDKSLYEYIQESIALSFEDERMNLNKDCGLIIAIADLGLWNGRRTGYKVSNAYKLNAIFDMLNGDDVEVYVEGNDLKAEVKHHDGVNYITFREVKEGKDITKLCNMLYDGENVTQRQISYYTRPLGKKVKEIYGW